MGKLKYWILAARPKTLPASVMPVLVACALAVSDGVFAWLPALICFLFALLAQIISNYLNDYFDFVKGSDRSDRLGPRRAVASGWVEPKAMLYASLALGIIACGMGSVLMILCGWQLLFVGLAVCLGAYAYSGGPYPLAYRGWGDVCVMVFYGIIPVVFTYYVQAMTWDPTVWLTGLAMGIVSINILVSNNYRDREQDKLSDKRTSIVLFGEKFGEYFYLINGIIVTLLGVWILNPEDNPLAFLFGIYLVIHLFTWRKMCRIHQGAALNPILGESARNTVVYGLVLIVGVLFS